MSPLIAIKLTGGVVGDGSSAVVNILVTGWLRNWHARMFLAHSRGVKASFLFTKAEKVSNSIDLFIR